MVKCNISTCLDRLRGKPLSNLHGAIQCSSPLRIAFIDQLLCQVSQYPVHLCRIRHRKTRTVSPKCHRCMAPILFADGGCNFNRTAEDFFNFCRISVKESKDMPPETAYLYVIGILLVDDASVRFTASALEDVDRGFHAAMVFFIEIHLPFIRPGSPVCKKQIDLSIVLDPLLPIPSAFHIPI